MNTKTQIKIFFLLLGIYALVAFLTYTLFPLDQLTGGQASGNPAAQLPGWQLGLANAAIVLVVYGALGLAGLWFCRKLGLPGIIRADAGWKGWFWLPLGLGLGVGAVLAVVDRIIAIRVGSQGFAHPAFPLSIFASLSAGIGEEILFRLFVFGLWAFLLDRVLRHWKATPVALWSANIIAALAFSASHLPAAMLLAGVSSPAGLPGWVLAEIFALNSLLALVAGQRMMRDGLVAASGVHFWADIFWHGIYPLVLLFH